MICRTWRGRVANADADAYLAYLHETGVKAYRETPGNVSVRVLRRDVGGHTEFLLLSFWDSMESIRRFAGELPDEAVFYPEDDRYLVDRDLDVKHYDVAYDSAAD